MWLICTLDNRVYVLRWNERVLSLQRLLHYQTYDYLLRYLVIMRDEGLLSHSTNILLIDTTTVSTAVCTIVDQTGQEGELYQLKVALRPLYIHKEGVGIRGGGRQQRQNEQATGTGNRQPRQIQFWSTTMLIPATLRVLSEGELKFVSRFASGILW